MGGLISGPSVGARGRRKVGKIVAKASNIDRLLPSRRSPSDLRLTWEFSSTTRISRNRSPFRDPSSIEKTGNNERPT